MSSPKERATFLTQDEIPASWYNIQADLPDRLPPPLNPATHEPMSPEPLFRLFPKELVGQEVSQERWIKIPDELMEAYRWLPRPTPLYRAYRLENLLKTPAKIYYKWEGVNPTGSHKPNTALAQAYYNKKEGTERLVTETGAGQWGSALAMSSAYFGLKTRVYMVAASYSQKPGRRTMMETWGAECISSPSNKTKFGRSLLAKDPKDPGSLGIAISEAIEDTLTDEKSKYCLGSVLNHVLLHQTVIGLELKKQLELLDVTPDLVVGNIGGGSNFGGFCLPLMGDKITKNLPMEFVACESSAIPHTTKGKYTYDFGDTAGMTPLLKMYTLGKDYKTPPIHAGGLRYHAMAPIISYLIRQGSHEVGRLRAEGGLRGGGDLRQDGGDNPRSRVGSRDQVRNRRGPEVPREEPGEGDSLQQLRPRAPRPQRLPGVPRREARGLGADEDRVPEHRRLSYFLASRI